MSGLLFMIGIEILARVIKNDASIQGIKVAKKKLKSRYMQMTPLFLFVTLILLISPVWKLTLNRLKECGSVAGKTTPETPFVFR